MFTNDTIAKLSVRLPPDLRSWVADAALEGRRSMNSLIIEAVHFLKLTRADERRGRKHEEAVSHAVELAKGSRIFIVKSDKHPFQTELLDQKPGDDKPTLFARITDEHVQIFGKEEAGIFPQGDE